MRARTPGTVGAHGESPFGDGLPSERPRRRGWLGILLIVAIAAIAVAAVGGWWLLADDPPPDDGDLVVELPPRVPFETTVRAGFVDLATRLEAAWRDAGSGPFGPHEQWTTEYRDCFRGDEWDEPTEFPHDLAPIPRTACLGELVERWDPVVERWQEILADLADILARPALGRPEGFVDAGPGHAEARAIVRILRVVAWHARWHGDAPTCLEAIARMGAIGERIARDATTILDRMVANTATRLADDAVCSLLHEPGFPGGWEREWLAGDGRRFEDAHAFGMLLRREYTELIRPSILDLPTLLVETGTSEEEVEAARYLYKPHRTLAVVADLQRTSIAIAAIPAVRRPEIPRAVTPGDLSDAILGSRNAGAAVIPLLQANLESVITRWDAFRARRASARTLIALRAHERELLDLPLTLEDLARAVPEYGPVPRDPYDGEPLRYDSTYRIVWSVGEDGVDGGARKWWRAMEESDLLWGTLEDEILWLPPIEE